MTFLRALLAAAAATIACAGLPAAATASSRQFSIMEDPAFIGHGVKDPDAAMTEAKALGVDAVRAFITWSRAAPAARERNRPAGFDPGDPDSQGYDWSNYDAFVKRARSHKLKVIFSLAGEIPWWASREPHRCPHRIGGYRNLAMSCFWKPDAKQFGQFAKAVARRYRGKVYMYSVWNEPNLEHYLYPQSQRTRSGTVDLGGKQLRELWLEGYRGIRAGDARMAKRVLFGETAAISSPLDTLYSALCLNERGRPYTGRMKALQGCSKPVSLPIAGLAIHPYNNGARGHARSKTHTRDSLPLAYVSRATRVLRQAERYRRVPRGRGVYITEFGFQTRPPDRRGLSFNNQAKALNESERLFFGDPRVRSVAQFELFDAHEPDHEDVYNTGLRTHSGKPKPSLAAYRMPLVVTRLGRDRVEVWGGVRSAPARTTPVVEVARRGGAFKRLSGARTNPAGYFRFTVRRAGADRLRYRVGWRDAKRHLFRSRVATPAAPLVYLEKP